jgi:pimeloyl-ACP methyl ester carboxylesterase
MQKGLSKSVVFITGTFIGNNCWDDWKSYFESKGYKCIAPSWPNKEGSPEQLRNDHPDSDIALITINTLMDHFESVIKALPEKPILIGHSLGGLIVQLLLQRDLGAAGIAMHSFPPKGIGFRFSFLEGMWEAIGLFTPVRKTHLISFRKWKCTIANELTCNQQKQLYYKYAIPESKLVIRDIFKSVAKIHFNQPHAPLLLTSGGQDKMISFSLNYRNYEKYKRGSSITDYKEFREHNHLVFGHPAWRENAEFIVYWLEGLTAKTLERARHL